MVASGMRGNSFRFIGDAEEEEFEEEAFLSLLFVVAAAAAAAAGDRDVMGVAFSFLAFRFFADGMTQF